MRLTREHTIAVHRGELTPGQAFALQAAEAERVGTDAQAIPSRHGAPEIPHILHFIWFGEAEPEIVTYCRNSVARQYPGWAVRVWREPPADWPPEWQAAFERCEGNHSDESDVVRWWALLTVGGMYWDADFVGIRPLPQDAFAHPFAASFGNRRGKHCNAFRLHGRQRSAFCGWLASVPGDQTVAAISADMLTVTDRAFGALGMAPLARAIKRGGVHLVASHSLYPVGAVRGARQWSAALEYALRQSKPEDVCAVHLWLGGKSYADCTAAWEANHDATGAVTNMVLTRRVFASLETAAIRCGLLLKGFCSRDNFRARRKETANFVTWGVKWRSDWYRKGGRNVLYLENGLLCQRSGIYVDHAGYFCDSSIATESQPDPTPAEVAGVQAHARRHFGWDWFAGGNPDGPIMIVGQTHNDCSVRYHYHPGRGSAPAMQPLCDACADYLPTNVPVIVRPHPRDRAGIHPDWMRPDWTLDTSTNIYETLRECRAVVTVSSTVATEALALGLPVACLGRSAWEGHGVVLECAADYSRLVDLLDWQPEEWPVLRYLAAVLRHQLPYDASPEQVAACASVRVWLDRAGKPLGVLSIVDQVTEAAARIRASGDAGRIQILGAIEAKLRTCKVCSRARLHRQIIELEVRDA